MSSGETKPGSATFCEIHSIGEGYMEQLLTICSDQQKALEWLAKNQVEKPKYGFRLKMIEMTPTIKTVLCVQDSNLAAIIAGVVSAVKKRKPVKAKPKETPKEEPKKKTSPKRKKVA